jgi:hypothetical protein
MHSPTFIFKDIVCTQNYWGFGLCPLSGILEAGKQCFGNWICFRPQVRGKYTHFRPLEKSNFNPWTTPVRFATATGIVQLILRDQNE